MPVESVTYISDLVATNPVGATDPKSQGDDHIRNIKAAILATFPAVAGAVTASHAQLSTLNEGTLPACNGSALTDLNGSEVTTGTVADARLSSNVPLKNAAPQVFGGGNSRSNAFRLQRAADGSSAPQLIAFWSDADGNFVQAESLTSSSKHLILRATTDAAGSSGSTEPAVRIRGRANSDLAVFSDSAITVNGVNVTDYARLSQANVFGTATAGISERMAIGAEGVTRLTLQNTDDEVTTMLLAEAAEGVVGTLTNHPLDIRAGNSSAISVDTALKATFKGAVAAPTIAQSTSTTLAAGQVHAIDGNATLPNMAAGQWVTVINNGSSARTVTKNGSDTMYWTATGSSVTSVTIPARGRASFVCADGTNVYASGNISGSS